jgi:hypothetical protein
VGGVLAALNEILEGYNVIRTPAVLSKKVSGISLETAASVMNPLQCIGDTMFGLRFLWLSIVFSTFSSVIPEKRR